MSAFDSRLGFLILSVVLLFAWLAIAAFATPELAFFVGFGVLMLWMFFFLPVGFLKEIIWQARQRKIMKAALEAAPAYQPGSALPPPMAGNALSVVPQSSGGALDVYRDDLPQLLPRLEPRDHMLPFKRSLVLPVLGILMMIGASNDTLMQKLLEARGIMQKLPVEWSQLSLPPQYADKKSEMEEAARMAIRRESGCAKILSGGLAALAQFHTPAEQAQQIANGEYVYEFYCQETSANTKPYLIWIGPDEISRGSFSSLASNLTHAPTNDEALKACREAGDKVLGPLGASLLSGGAVGALAPRYNPGHMPYPDYVRVLTTETLVRGGVPGGNVEMSCWAGSEGETKVRFLRAN